MNRAGPGTAAVPAALAIREGALVHSSKSPTRSTRAAGTAAVPGLVRVASAAAGLAAVGLVLAQPPQPPAKGKDTRYYSDREALNSCGLCHKSRPPGFALADKDSLVLLNEFTAWQHHDLHRRACDALSSPLGVQMSRLLYGDPKAAAKKADCLVCHATDTAPGAPLSADIPGRFSCDLGVNCQSCHGPAAKWDGPHRLGDWRPLTGHEKTATYGMTNLRDPAVRARTCVGCHVGSTDEGKFVTHDMYAAGHPPLPAFELATFSRDEPRHWLSPADVPYIRGLEPAAAAERYSYRKGEVEAARLAAVGAVVGFRRAIDLLRFDPDPARPSPGLDFAHFNCAACHHDLRVPSDRQINGFPGVPGRPVPQTWSVWLVRAVLRHAQQSGRDGAEQLRTEFEAGYDTLRQTFDARPFGEKEKVLQAARALDATCEKVQKLVEGIVYDEPTARGLFAALAAEAAADPGPAAARRRDFLDADGAAQIARAFAAVYAELAGGYAEPPKDGPPSPDSLKSDPAGIAKLLAEIDAELPLAVRPNYRNGLDESGKPLPGAETFLIQHEQLGQRLRKASEFKPAEYRRQFAEIARRLAADPK
ncbi:MAG TPA: multiheme c-type cytochrome [Fimbriiglobus sp.]|nr:multiheme c-type cytochrome [Fimbriiglobus sp.]